MKTIILVLTMFWSFATLARDPQVSCFAKFVNRIGSSIDSTTGSAFKLLLLKDDKYVRTWKYKKHTVQIKRISKIFQLTIKKNGIVVLDQEFDPTRAVTFGNVEILYALDCEGEAKKLSPEEVKKIMDRPESCDYWLGEEGFNEARREKIEAALKESKCDSLDSDLKLIPKQ